MRLQKDDELEQYKKEIERAKRFENQKHIGASGADGSAKPIVKKKVMAAGSIKRAVAPNKWVATLLM